MKSGSIRIRYELLSSPSSRAEWVEISISVNGLYTKVTSPSSRAEWVEIIWVRHFLRFHKSPSSRAEWVEISRNTVSAPPYPSPSSRAEWVEILMRVAICACSLRSPSSRAEWVEIMYIKYIVTESMCLRPRGRSGLKYFMVSPLSAPVSVSVLAGGVG